MARHSLPRVLSSGPSLDRGRDLARRAADGATEALRPLISIARGLRLQAAWVAAWWVRTPGDRRGPTLLLGAAVLVVTTLLPYGPLLATAALLASAAWTGRDRAAVDAGPSDTESTRLQALYEALVPYLSDPHDPSPLYAHDGTWDRVFTQHTFENGRLALLRLRYPAYFTDSETASRARVEKVLQAKTGRGREYRFDWNEEENHLTLVALPPLDAGIAAQRFVTAQGETVLGFTDPEAVHRTVPVTDGVETRDAAPVLWRTGPRSTEPHLLVLGQPGSGVTSLLRSIALQALGEGDLLVVDGGGTGEYACFIGRPGVLAVESGLAGAAATLEWATHETERRLIALNRARQLGLPMPADVRRPLWILTDRLSALSQLADAEGRPDPHLLLEVPLRHGRAANVAVAVADQLDALDQLTPAVTANTRARVILGLVSAEHTGAVLGAPHGGTTATHVPAGRGYARLGSGPVLRLQVPATPDPYDEEAGETERQAVFALLGASDASTADPDRRLDTAPTEPGTVRTDIVVRPAADLELEH